MFCFKCGSQQADDAKFCGVCGTRLAGVVGPQPEPAVSVPATAAPSEASVPAPLDTPASDSSLTVEEWSVICAPPDSDGDVRFKAKVRGEFHGSASAHVARLSWVAFDASGSIPLLQADNTLTQDIDDEDSIEVEASAYGKLGETVEPATCQIRGQVVLCPGEKQAPWTIPLPEAGQAGGEGPAWPDMSAEIAGWRLTCSDRSEASASFTLCIVARNFGARALAAVTFRVRVKNRKGDVWSTDYVVVERLAPGEMRSVETNLYVSERAKARKGAIVELIGVVCPLALVHSLAPTVAVLRVEDAAGDDDGANGTVDETEDEEPGASHDDGDEDTEHAEGDEAASDEDGPEISMIHVEPPFLSYQVNDETVLEASDDFESTAIDFESEVLGRINSSGEVGRFRKQMVRLARMVVKGSYRANWVTCESEDSRIDLIFRPGYVTCVVHKYVVESD